MLKNKIKKSIRFFLGPFILKDFVKMLFLSRNNDKRFNISFKNIYPCIKDKTVKTGFDRHYVYHTSWAARKVREIDPKFHTDISSSLYFSGIVSAFVPVKFYDFRPADLGLDNLDCLNADLTDLPFESNSVSSLSCMHVVEHIGLGRYGDPLDSEGDLKAIRELKRVLAKDGSLLFVVPMGNEAKVEFNAHRIYTYAMVAGYFKDFEIKEFIYIPENDGVPIVNKKDLRIKDNYGCGCFWFIKK